MPILLKRLMIAAPRKTRQPVKISRPNAASMRHIEKDAVQRSESQPIQSAQVSLHAPDNLSSGYAVRRRKLNRPPKRPHHLTSDNKPQIG